MPFAGIVSLGARVRLFVRPKFREKFNSMFRDVLGCKFIEHDLGLPHPLLFVPLSDGSGFSVEFTEAAPEDYPGTALDDEHAFPGAWIDFRMNPDPFASRSWRGAL